MKAESLGSLLEKKGRVQSLKAQTQNVQHFLGSPENQDEDGSPNNQNGLHVQDRRESSTQALSLLKSYS